MRSNSRSKAVGFNKQAVPASANFTPENKLDFIRKGKKKKTITGFKENKNVTFENKGGKFVVVEKEKKFEETEVTKRKRNFVKFESKLGTEKETDMTKIEGAKKLRAIQPRQEEKIIQTRKRKEYLDNYQYHETVDIKHPKPNRVSVVEHKRLGDIISGFEEVASFEREVRTTGGDGRGQVLRQKATSVTKSRGGNKPSTSTVSKQTKREMKPYTHIEEHPFLNKNSYSGQQIIAAEFFVEVRLVNFHLVPVVKPVLFTATHLQMREPEACQNRYNCRYQQNQPAKLDLKTPQSGKNLVDTRNLHKTLNF